MIEALQPFMNYDFGDDGNGGKIFYGYLYVADKK